MTKEKEQNETKSKRIQSSEDLLPNTSFSVDGSQNFIINFSLTQMPVTRADIEFVLIEVKSLFEKDTDDWSRGFLSIPKPAFNHMVETLLRNQEASYDDPEIGKIEFKRGDHDELLFRFQSQQHDSQFLMSGFGRIDGVTF